MKEKLTVSCEGKPCYDIVLTIGFEELAGAALRFLHRSVRFASLRTQMLLYFMLRRSRKLFPLPLHR